MNSECSIWRVLIFSVNFAPGYPRRYTATQMPHNRDLPNPFSSPDAASPIGASGPKPRSLTKRIALTFMFSVLLGVAMFFAFAVVGRTIALATLDSELFNRLQADYGVERARGLYITYWAHNCGDKALLVGLATPWLYFWYSSSLRKTCDHTTGQHAV